MLRFVHISDTHIGPSTDYMLYGVNTHQKAEELVQFINNDLPFSPDFVLHTGDVAYDPDAQATRLAHDVLSQIKYPLYVVRGNHDDPNALRDYFANLPQGDGRLYYDFVVKDFHFIVLDTFGLVQPSGHLDDAQLEWLQKTLTASNARSIVMIVHHIPTITGNAWLDERMRIMNDDALFAILEPYQARIRGMFFGHIHDFSAHQHHGILCSSTAAAFSQFIYPENPDERFMVAEPGGFSLVTVRHDGPTTILHHLMGGH